MATKVVTVGIREIHVAYVEVKVPVDAPEEVVHKAAEEALEAGNELMVEFSHRLGREHHSIEDEVLLD